MNKIVELEKMLRENKVNTLRLQHMDTPEAQKEHRVMLIQRTNLKDMLLNAYRKEFIQTIKVAQ